MKVMGNIACDMDMDSDVEREREREGVCVPLDLVALL
jgi:hypothetical protein